MYTTSSSKFDGTLVDFTFQEEESITKRRTIVHQTPPTPMTKQRANALKFCMAKNAKSRALITRTNHYQCVGGVSGQESAVACMQ